MKKTGSGESVCCYYYDGPEMRPGFAPQAGKDVGICIYVDEDLVLDHVESGEADMGLVLSLDDIMQDVIEGNEQGEGGPIDAEDAGPWIARLRQWADVLEARCDPDGIPGDSDGV